MNLSHYKHKHHKKTDIRFDTLIECLVWLVKYLKTWKGTPAEIELIERQINEVKDELELIDPALERIMNPAICVRLNGYQKLEV